MKTQIPCTKEIEICDFCRERPADWVHCCAICGKVACIEDGKAHMVRFRVTSDHIRHCDGSTRELTGYTPCFCKEHEGHELIKMHQRLERKLRAIDRLIEDAEELGRECEREQKHARQLRNSTPS